MLLSASSAAAVACASGADAEVLASGEVPFAAERCWCLEVSRLL